MGIVSEVLSAEGKDIKSDRGSGDNVTAQHFSAPGDDSLPLKGDYSALSQATGTGRQTSVGYRDGKLEGKAAPGEKRIYARSGPGEMSCEVWLKSTGEVIITNTVGTFVMQPTGDVVINGIILKADGSDIILATGKSLMHHSHPQANDSAGNTEQPTGDTIP